MHPQLELLLQIQDLRAQRRELRVGNEVRDLEVEAFNIDVDQVIAQLDETIDRIAATLPAPIRSRMEKLSARAGRAVVPLINGTCYGCFLAIPTASAGGLLGNDAIHFCDHCGRFLYLPSST